MDSDHSHRVKNMAPPANRHPLSKLQKKHLDRVPSQGRDHTQHPQDRDHPQLPQGQDLPQHPQDRDQPQHQQDGVRLQYPQAVHFLPGVHYPHGSQNLQAFKYTPGALYPHPDYMATSPVVDEDRRSQAALRTAKKALEMALMAVKEVIRKPITALEEVPRDDSRNRDTERAVDELIEASEAAREFINMVMQVADGARILARDIDLNKEAMIQAVESIRAAEQTIHGPDMRPTIDRLILNLKTIARD